MDEAIIKQLDEKGIRLSQLAEELLKEIPNDRWTTPLNNPNVEELGDAEILEKLKELIEVQVRRSKRLGFF